jgi:hypothetical protein
MDNKQQTAVDFAFEALANQGLLVYKEYTNLVAYQEAKEMEKEQIAKAFDDGDYNYHYSRKTGNDFEDGKEYFNEVYG